MADVPAAKEEIEIGRPSAGAFSADASSEWLVVDCVGM
jgi:hypothetical protein